MYKSFYYKLINFSLFFVFCFSFLNIGDAKALGFFDNFFQNITGNSYSLNSQNTGLLSTIISKIWLLKSENIVVQNASYDLNSSSLERVKNSSVCSSGNFSDQVECDRLKEQAIENDAKKAELKNQSDILQKLQHGADNSSNEASQSGGGSSPSSCSASVKSDRSFPYAPKV